MFGRRLPSEKLSVMRIGTRNVRTLNEVDKLENLKKEMKKLNLDITEVSAADKWPENNDFCIRDYRMINTAGKGG
ncbi:hypothetical protein PGB90_008421 [Kerria lacca]